MFIARAMCGITSAKVAALCSIGSLQKYLERWAAALSEERRSVSMVMTRPTITTVELHTFHLYQHYSLFTRNKLQYTWLEGLLRACAACRTPRLNLGFELPPSWNNIRDTFPTGTTQDTTLRKCCKVQIVKRPGLSRLLSPPVPRYLFTRDI